MFSGSTFKLLNSSLADANKPVDREEKFSPKLEASFVFFDLNLSPEQKSTLAAFKISQKKSFRNNGNFETILDDIQKFIDELDPENTQISLKMAELILEIIKKVISEMQQETAWIVMEASLPNDNYKYPRWHTDGCYFPPYTSEQFKVVVALKGPGTLFYNLPDAQREQFNSLRCVRIKTGEMLKDVKPVSPDFGQGAVFVAGSLTRAAVHSEPHIDRDRLFLAIAPCSRKQMEDKLEHEKKYQNDPAFKKALEEAIKNQLMIPKNSELSPAASSKTVTDKKSGNALLRRGLFAVAIVAAGVVCSKLLTNRPSNTTPKPGF